MFQNDVSSRVRFAETDQQGVVYFRAFFERRDEAAMAAWREMGFDYERRLADGWTAHVVHAEMDYKSPATYGDILVDSTQFESIGETSFTMAYEATIQNTGRVVAKGETVYAVVDAETDDPTPVPASFRDAAVNPTHSETDQ